MRQNFPERTAITRKKISKPMRHLVDTGLLRGRCLDYGCGKGYDADTLGLDSYDPHHRPSGHVNGLYDTITCNYVLNVLPTQAEREAVIEGIQGRLSMLGVAYISVRNDRANLKGYTKRDTYQGLVELDLPVVKRDPKFVMYCLRKEN